MLLYKCTIICPTTNRMFLVLEKTIFLYGNKIDSEDLKLFEKEEPIFKVIILTTKL